MNKQELISAMSAETGLTKKDCGAALEAYISTVKVSLKKGEPVRLVGFGTFNVKSAQHVPGKIPELDSA